MDEQAEAVSAAHQRHRRLGRTKNAQAGRRRRGRLAQLASVAFRFGAIAGRDDQRREPAEGRQARSFSRRDLFGIEAFAVVASDRPQHRMLRFALMLLNQGTLDGTRILGRKTVEYMTADHLGPDVDASRLHQFAVEHIDGSGFGLGVAVRRQTGIAGVPGSPGEFLWSGAQGTMFWVDPKEELAVVFLANTPGPIRRHYREVVKNMVLQAIVD
jgi:hypothetical protein